MGFPDHVGEDLLSGQPHSIDLLGIGKVPLALLGDELHEPIPGFHRCRSINGSLGCRNRAAVHGISGGEA